MTKNHKKEATDMDPTVPRGKNYQRQNVFFKAFTTIKSKLKFSKK